MQVTVKFRRVPCPAPELDSMSCHRDWTRMIAVLKQRTQIVKFFAAVGAALEAEVESRRDGRPVWLSTSGLGVYW